MSLMNGHAVNDARYGNVQWHTHGILPRTRPQSSGLRSCHSPIQGTSQAIKVADVRHILSNVSSGVEIAYG